MLRWAKIALAVATIVIVGLILIGRSAERDRATRSRSTAVLAPTDGDRLPSFGGETATTDAPATAPAAAPGAPATSGATLPPGEYACVGSGGSILAGLGFKVDASGGYTDLDNTTHGTVSVSGSDITFSGGHLDGTPGRNYHGKNFVVGSMATCEKWG